MGKISLTFSQQQLKSLIFPGNLTHNGAVLTKVTETQIETSCFEKNILLT